MRAVHRHFALLKFPGCLSVISGVVIGLQLLVQAERCAVRVADQDPHAAPLKACHVDNS